MHRSGNSLFFIATKFIVTATRCTYRRTTVLYSFIFICVSSDDRSYLPPETAIPRMTYVSSESSSEGYPKKIEITVSRYRFVLTLNQHLISPKYRYIVHGDDRRDMKLSNCYYQGHLRPFEFNKTLFMGWNAAVSMCVGFSGYFGHPGAGYMAIEPVKGVKTIHQKHKVYQPSGEFLNMSRDALTPAFVNGSKSRFNVSGKKESDDVNDEVNPFIEAEVYVDHFKYRRHPSKLHELDLLVVSVINEVDHLFRKLGIEVVLVGMHILKHDDTIKGHPHINKILKNFNKYLSCMSHPRLFDVAILFSGGERKSEAIGNAYVDSLCHWDYNGVVVDTLLVPRNYLAQVTAHEIGHALGITHYDKKPGMCVCEDSIMCIMKSMYSADGAPPHSWSSCSVDSAKKALKKKRCLFIAHGGGSTILAIHNATVDSLLLLSLFFFFSFLFLIGRHNIADSLLYFN